MENQAVRTFSFQDISRQINRSEVEAWQKLIQVLRHEIMNSISPIRIMSGNLLNIVRHLNQSSSESNQSAKEEFSRLSEGLSTIRKRSSGLSDFIEKYRSLTKIPEPSFSHINVSGLFQHVTDLMKEQLNKERFSYIIQALFQGNNPVGIAIFDYGSKTEKFQPKSGLRIY